jgi:prephenate dehydratase
MKVGYLGPEGTFSEEAGKEYCRKVEGKVEMVPFPTFHDLLTAVDRGRMNEAMVPIENSIEGTIGVVTDMLAKEVNLRIRQEIVLPVSNYLLAKKGARLHEITDIISHPQPIEQCKAFIRKKLPKARLHLSHSTSEAARQVALSPRGFAAIGPLSLARLYGLSVIARKINPKDNQTRFVVLAKKDHPRTGKDKSSIVFSISRNIPGGLQAILFEFACRLINLTKIESRPSKKALGDYYFFLDLEGHRDDKDVAQALAGVKKKTAFFKFLGSYPKFK